jgi:hypothetical protein
MGGISFTPETIFLEFGELLLYCLSVRITTLWGQKRDADRRLV